MENGRTMWARMVKAVFNTNLFAVLGITLIALLVLAGLNAPASPVAADPSMLWIDSLSIVWLVGLVGLMCARGALWRREEYEADTLVARLGLSEAFIADLARGDPSMPWFYCLLVHSPLQLPPQHRPSGGSPAQASVSARPPRRPGSRCRPRRCSCSDIFVQALCLSCLSC